MTVKEYNSEFLPKVNRAKEFIRLFESAIQHMDDALVDKDEMLRQFKLHCWSDETRQLILKALSYYQEHKGRDKIVDSQTDVEDGTNNAQLALDSMKKCIPTKPIREAWSPNTCPNCGADLGGECNDGYYQNPFFETCPECRQVLNYDF